MLKNSYKKAIACFLLICMTFSIGIGFASAEPNVKDINPTQAQEVISLRETNSKTYQLADGSYQFVGYAEDIHFEDENGQLLEINNAITDKNVPSGYAFGNTQNSWKVHFADTLSKNNAVVLQKKNYKITFSMPAAKEQAKATKSNALKNSNKKLEKELSEDDRTVVYKNVLPGVDIAYTAKTNVLKEDIILNNPSATNVFEMEISAKGVSIVERDGGVFFVDGEGNEVFRLAPLFMVDANGKYSEEVTYAIKTSKKGAKLTITADRDFLDAADTQYPVTIDPSVMVTGGSDTFDTCVDEQYPNSNYYLSENLWTGGKTGTNTMRTYIRFDLPATIRGANVTSAYLRIKKRDYATPTIKAYRVTGSWDSSAVKWNSKPGYTTTNGTGTIALDTGSWYKLNVTTLVKNWMNGTYVNHGFLLKEPSETSTTQKTKFYSSDAPSPNKPELIINYSVLRPTKTFDIKLYKNSNMSTSLTTLSNYINTASTVFNDTFRVKFNISSSGSTTALNQKSGCHWGSSSICRETTNSSTNCGANSNCKAAHHKSGTHFLYVHEGTSKVVRYVDYKLCHNSSSGHGEVYGLAVSNKDIITSLHAPNVQRTTCHEFAHWIGAKDKVCITTQPCVMTYGSNVYNVWCTQCKKDIVKFLE